MWGNSERFHGYENDGTFFRGVRDCGTDVSGNTTARNVKEVRQQRGQNDCHFSTALHDDTPHKNVSL